MKTYKAIIAAVATGLSCTAVTSQGSIHSVDSWNWPCRDYWRDGFCITPAATMSFAGYAAVRIH